MPKPRTKPREPAEAAQPALFEPGDLPDLPLLVTAAKAYLHNGRTTCRNEERAEQIVLAYLQTGSLLAVARRFSCSPNTVKAVLAVAEEHGKLDDLKQRLSGKLGTVAELATDAQVEALMAGRVPANVLPIMLGVAVEKKMLLDGDATARIEVAPVAPVGAQDVARYLAAKGISAPAIDVQSTVLQPEPQETGGKP